MGSKDNDDGDDDDDDDVKLNQNFRIYRISWKLNEMTTVFNAG